MRFSLLLLCCSLLAAEAVPAPAMQTGERLRLGVIVDAGAFDPNKGLPVKGVTPGTTAAVLGVLPGDLLTAINGAKVTSEADVQAALALLQVGHPIAVDVVRTGAAQHLTGTVVTPPTTASLLREVGEAQRQLDEVRQAVDVRTREPTLAELLRELQILQEQFPLAAAEFKKLYPKGEFSIIIRITSDTTAKEPIDLMQLTNPVPAPELPPVPAPAP